MDEARLTRRRGWKLTLVLLASTLICAVSFPILLLALAMAPMLFDAPGSEQQPLPWLMLALVFVAPVACVVGCGGGWIAYILKHTRTAWTFALLPLPLLAVYLAVFGAPLFERSSATFGSG